MTREMIGWTLAGLGGVCGIAAAALQGGLVAALSAASGVLTVSAGVFGYVSKPPATK